MMKIKISDKIQKGLCFIAGVIATTLIMPTIKTITEDKYREIKDKKLITYQIKNLSSIKDRNVLLRENYNLNLDDQYIEGYKILKINLKNTGISLTDPVAFNLKLTGNLTKILDIKHQVITPKNKDINFLHSIPDIEYRSPKEKDKISIAWRSYSSQNNFNIYGSFFEKAGYGRLNAQTLAKPCVILSYDDLKDYGNYYFKFSYDQPFAIPYPEILGFSPLFKDAHVDQDNECVDYGKETDNSDDEIEGETKKYLSEEELLFLKGIVKFSFPDGLDKNTETDISILYKSYLDSVKDVSLYMIGCPGVELTEKESKVSFAPTQKTSSHEKSKKDSLTPKYVITYKGEKSIYITWAKPEIEYSGVKILRSLKGKSLFPKEEGEEIYDGIGINGSLTCDGHSDFSTPPPVINSNFVPSPKDPNILTLKGVTVIDETDLGDPYFEDKSVLEDSDYTYVLVAYDSEGNYSYPVITNFSMNDNLVRNCRPAIVYQDANISIFNKSDQEISHITVNFLSGEFIMAGNILPNSKKVLTHKVRDNSSYEILVQFKDGTILKAEYDHLQHEKDSNDFFIIHKGGKIEFNREKI